MDWQVGSYLRYEGLGSGEIIDFTERKFQGKLTTFAVIRFPHREMTAQLPLDDERVKLRLHKVVSATKARKLVRSLQEDSDSLPGRRAEERVEGAKDILSKGGPDEWAELLRAYAHSKRLNHAHLAADLELAREAQEMLAAELACATGQDYEKAIEKVKSNYRNAST